MKISNVPGEFGWKALVYFSIPEGCRGSKGYRLTEEFFFSEEDVRDTYHDEQWRIKWPVEVMDNGTVYVPDPSELE